MSTAPDIIPTHGNQTESVQPFLPLFLIVFFLLIILRCLRFWAFYDEAQQLGRRQDLAYHHGSVVTVDMERNRLPISVPTAPYLIVLPTWTSNSSYSQTFDSPPPIYQPPPSYNECVPSPSAVAK